MRSVTLLTALSLSVILAACGPMTTMDSDSSSSAMVADRRPCTEKDFYGPPSQDLDAFFAKWNADTATTMVELDRTDSGFRAMLPYNPAWGTDECQLTHFDLNENHITFGFASGFEGGSVTRFDMISILPARTAEAALASANATVQGDIDAGIVPKEMAPAIVTVHGHAAVKYVTSGLCPETVYELIGRTANYRVMSICDADAAGIDAVLESFVIL